MTWPRYPVHEDPVEDEAARWGVSPDPPVARPSRTQRILWIILSLLIILSLTLPWLLPYFTPRPFPEMEGIEVMIAVWASRLRICG